MGLESACAPREGVVEVGGREREVVPCDHGAASLTKFMDRPGTVADLSAEGTSSLHPIVEITGIANGLFQLLVSPLLGAILAGSVATIITRASFQRCKMIVV